MGRLARFDCNGALIALLLQLAITIPPANAVEPQEFMMALNEGPDAIQNLLDSGLDPNETIPGMGTPYAPTSAELTQLTHTIAQRLARYLERQGLLVRDAEHSYLALENSDEDPKDQLRGHSITYRIAVGPQQGRKVFTLQTLPDERDADETPATGSVAGFSLHAGVAAKANQRDKVRSRSDRERALGYKLERLCRYITRPAIAEKRLSLTNQGKVRYELKTPYRDGTTHVIFEPVDFIAKLAALVPRPRVNLDTIVSPP